MKNIMYILSFIFLLNFTNVIVAKTGKEIFTNFCNTCHSPSMAAMFGAPPFNDKNAWEIRKELAFKRAMEKSKFDESNIILKEKKILEAFFDVAKVGTPKGMPPKGTCVSCTDDELLDAVKYLSTTN